MRKIYNVGCVPPPVGGISYFLRRLKQQLDLRRIDNEIIDVSGIDCGKKDMYGVQCLNCIQAFLYLLFSKKGIVIFHSNRIPVLMGAYFLHFRHKILIFTHGESILKNNRCKKLFLHYANGIVSPIEELTKRIIKSYPEYVEKIIHVPFILYPTEVNKVSCQSMVDFKDNYPFLIVGYAYKITSLNGVDLYGVDMMIELMHQLILKGYKNVGMLLLIPDYHNTELENRTIGRIRDYNLTNIYVHKERVDEASDVFAFGDIYVRPSCSDGDSFAIWEALYVGTPVIASDAVERPMGCVTFKNRDMGDFICKVIDVMNNYEIYKKQVKELQIQGSENKLIDLFGCFED